MSNMLLSRFKPICHNERGMVSITVTLIVMVVLSLIVVGFAQVSRRNQRQAIDQQLSTQAFYAAESGINDIRNLIKNAGAGVTVPDKPDCRSGGDGGFYNSLNSTIDSVANVKYTCLLVNPAPPSLVYGSIDERATIVPINAESGSFSSLSLTWKSTTSDTPSVGCPADTTRRFSHIASWDCGYGVLRFDLVPVDASFNIDELSNSVMSSFAVPLNGAGSNVVNYAAGPSNDILGVSCNDNNCNLTISNLSERSYYMRISSLYKAVSLEITAATASGPVNLTDAQVLIDATGKAQDVLRRVQVRVPVADTSRNKLPDHAIQSNDSLCKRFSVMQNRFDNDGGLAGTVGGGPMCDQSL